MSTLLRPSLHVPPRLAPTDPIQVDLDLQIDLDEVAVTEKRYLTPIPVWPGCRSAYLTPLTPRFRVAQVTGKRSTMSNVEEYQS